MKSARRSEITEQRNLRATPMTTQLGFSLVAAGAVAALVLAPMSPAVAIEGLRFAADAIQDQEVGLAPDAATSPGSADGGFRFNRKLSKLNVRVRVQGLLGDVVAAHLHCAVAGQNGPVIVDLEPTDTSGLIVRGEFFNEDIVEVDCTETCEIEVNNIASLRAAAEQGCLYLNVHTTEFSGGEVRGQLLANPVRATFDVPAQ